MTVSQQRKVRVLIVTQNLDHGGLEEVVLTYATFLDSSLYDVAVACRKQGIVASEIATLPAVQLFCYDASGRWRRFAALWQFARSFRPDIVHNHFNWYGLIIGLLVGAKRVETIHNTYHWFPSGQRIAYNLYCLLASRVIAVSEHVRRFSRRLFPLLRLKTIEVVHNGISPARFQPPLDERLRRELEIAPTDVVVGFIGRLEEQKGITHLLHAVAALSKDFPNVKVVIAGEGSWKQRLQDEASALGLRNVLFLGFRRDTPHLLRVFDVFVLPSLFEGLPVVLIEAMAAGCAVVATRIGGVEEVVVDGFNGILVQPGDSQSLASALRSLITDGEMRKRLGKQAQRHAAQEFSAKVMVERTEAVYRELVPRLFETVSR